MHSDVEAGAGGRAAGRAAAVLVIDDDVAVRRSLASVLAGAGMDALECGSADEALRVARLRHPDAAVVDFRLPDGDGLALAEELRKIDPQLPVLLLTGYASTESAVAAVGQLDAYLLKPVAPALLIDTVHQALDRRRQIEENRRLVVRLTRLNAYQALYDPLTALPNRALLEDRLHQAVASARRTGQRVAVLFVGLDRFTAVNDVRGHHAGDWLLKVAAARLAAQRRAADTVARFGGDEFVVVAPDIPDLATACRLADHLLGVLADPVAVEDREHRLTASIGIALSDPADVTSTPETLLRDADTAMDRAKEAGGGTWEVYDDTMRARLRERFDTEQGLRVAVSRGELALAYQPLVSLVDGRVCGAEALVRWDRPGRARELPGAFLPVAEEVGLVDDIDRWVLERAVADLGAARASGLAPADFRLWVNVSPARLATDDLGAEVHELLRAHAVPATMLGVEIVEDSIADPGAAERSLRRLCQLGVAVALDDFGTGHSTLARLVDLPITGLKIDQQFVAELGRAEESARGTAVVLGIIGLARALHLSLVAEGVETARQAEVLRRLGCEEAQGFHFARPGPVDVLWAAVSTSLRL